MHTLSQTILAPWIQKATALIGKARKVGGNQFRHMMSTLAILIDYNYVDPALLKASVIHDLIEDIPETNVEELRCLDHDGNEVVNIVFEVSRRQDETKAEFLRRIKENGSYKAKVLKVADRISNLTDLHRTIFHSQHYLDYIHDTELYVIPIAEEVNTNMANELKDLVKIRRLNVN